VAVVPMTIGTTVKPKSLGGKRNNIEWSIAYDMANKQWHWRVTIILEPQVFEGDAATLNEAKEQVRMCIPKHKL